MHYGHSPSWAGMMLLFTALSAFVQKVNDAKPQDFSNVMIGCAEMCHWDSSMEGLAGSVSKQSEQQWGKWNGQDLANSLYAWAMLTAAAPAAASESLVFKSMAQQLFLQIFKERVLCFY